MPAVTTKEDLLSLTQKEYDKLEKLITPLSEHAALNRDADGLSIRDIIARRAHWIGLFLGWVSDGRAGRIVHIPAKGYNWGQLKAYNAILRDQHAGLSWPDALGQLASQHCARMSLLDGMAQTDLYGEPMPGQSKWTTGRYAEASGASHYRSAAKYVRAQMRAQG